MPIETMNLWDDPAVVLEAAKSAINLSNKMQELARALNALAVKIMEGK